MRIVLSGLTGSPNYIFSYSLDPTFTFDNSLVIYELFLLLLQSSLEISPGLKPFSWNLVLLTCLFHANQTDCHLKGNAPGLVFLYI